MYKENFIPTLIDPRADSTRAGVDSGWEWNFRMDPSGPGAVPGTRHSWLAPLVTRPGMPPGPFGAIRKTFIPIRLLLRMYCVSGWDWAFSTHFFCGKWLFPTLFQWEMTLSHWKQLSRFSALSPAGFEPRSLAKCWLEAGTLPTELLRIC